MPGDSAPDTESFALGSYSRGVRNSAVMTSDFRRDDIGGGPIGVGTILGGGGSVPAAEDMGRTPGEATDCQRNRQKGTARHVAGHTSSGF